MKAHLQKTPQGHILQHGWAGLPSVLALWLSPDPGPKSAFKAQSPKHPTPQKVVPQELKRARETRHSTSKTAAAASQPEQFPFIFPLRNLL